MKVILLIFGFFFFASFLYNISKSEQCAETCAPNAPIVGSTPGAGGKCVCDLTKVIKP